MDKIPTIPVKQFELWQLLKWIASDLEIFRGFGKISHVIERYKIY